ncbi:MAG: dickkopf-related protein [Nanoarchaeota archaeon]|nr:dickkopf-related protein [Nanoarchaeota archaeon]
MKRGKLIIFGLVALLCVSVVSAGFFSDLILRLTGGDNEITGLSIFHNLFGSQQTKFPSYSDLYSSSSLIPSSGGDADEAEPIQESGSEKSQQSQMFSVYHQNTLIVKDQTVKLVDFKWGGNNDFLKIKIGAGYFMLKKENGQSIISNGVSVTFDGSGADNVGEYAKLKIEVIDSLQRIHPAYFLLETNEKIFISNRVNEFKKISCENPGPHWKVYFARGYDDGTEVPGYIFLELEGIMSYMKLKGIDKKAKKAIIQPVKSPKFHKNKEHKILLQGIELKKASQIDDKNVKLRKNNMGSIPGWIRRAMPYRFTFGDFDYKINEIEEKRVDSLSTYLIHGEQIDMGETSDSSTQTSTRKTCTIHSDCIEEDEVCYEGHCLRLFCDLTPCPEGFTCNDEMFCIPIPEATSCTDDGDCKYGERCMNGACEALSAGAVENKNLYLAIMDKINVINLKLEALKSSRITGAQTGLDIVRAAASSTTKTVDSIAASNLDLANMRLAKNLNVNTNNYRPKTVASDAAKNIKEEHTLEPEDVWSDYIYDSGWFHSIKLPELDLALKSIEKDICDMMAGKENIDYADLVVYCGSSKCQNQVKPSGQETPPSSPSSSSPHQTGTEVASQDLLDQANQYAADATGSGPAGGWLH